MKGLFKKISTAKKSIARLTFPQQIKKIFHKELFLEKEIELQFRIDSAKSIVDNFYLRFFFVFLVLGSGFYDVLYLAKIFDSGIDENKHWVFVFSSIWQVSLCLQFQLFSSCFTWSPLILEIYCVVSLLLAYSIGYVLILIQIRAYIRLKVAFFTNVYCIQNLSLVPSTIAICVNLIVMVVVVTSFNADDYFLVVAYLVELLFQSAFFMFLAYHSQLIQRRRFIQLYFLEQQTKEIATATNQNNRLLRTMLPQEIVDELRGTQNSSENEDVPGRQRANSAVSTHSMEVQSIKLSPNDRKYLIHHNYESATSVFVKILQFEEILEKFSAKEMVLLLNDMFQEFDRLVNRPESGCYRIKTIARIPGGRKDHLRQALKTCFMLIRMVQKNLFKALDVKIAIGLATGTIISGVIGITKPMFDCWGWTVNLSSRLANYPVDEVNVVHITENERVALSREEGVKVKLSDQRTLKIKGSGFRRCFLVFEFEETNPTADEREIAIPESASFDSSLVSPSQSPNVSIRTTSTNMSRKSDFLLKVLAGLSSSNIDQAGRAQLEFLVDKDKSKSGDEFEFPESVMAELTDDMLFSIDSKKEWYRQFIAQINPFTCTFKKKSLREHFWRIYWRSAITHNRTINFFGLLFGVIFVYATDLFRKLSGVDPVMQPLSYFQITLYRMIIGASTLVLTNFLMYTKLYSRSLVWFYVLNWVAFVGCLGGGAVPSYFLGEASTSEYGFDVTYFYIYSSVYAQMKGVSVFSRTLLVFGVLMTLFSVSCLKEGIVGAVKMLGGCAIAGFISLAAGTLYYFQTMESYLFKAINFKRKAFLDEEKRTTSELLMSILPKYILKRLVMEKEKDTVIASNYDLVGILNADIVSFTQLSQEITSFQLISILNESFSEFDKITVKYNTTKIKIVGDCYQMVSGCPRQTERHLFYLSLCVMEMQKWALAYKKIQFRFSLHCGPVIAGVIGVGSKLSYDIFGRTVFEVVQYESKGKPGRIHCSEKFSKHHSHECQENEFYEFRKRKSKVEIDGIQVESYWMIERESNYDMLVVDKMIMKHSKSEDHFKEAAMKDSF